MKIIAIAFIIILGFVEIGLRTAVGPPAKFLYSDGQRRVCVGRDDQRKIDVIGDSFAYGRGVAWNESFTGLLSCRHENISFRNLGLSSAGLQEYIAIAAQLVRPDATDVLVMLYGDDLTVPSDRGWPWIRRGIIGSSSALSLLRQWKQAAVGGSTRTGPAAPSPVSTMQGGLESLLAILRQRAPMATIWLAVAPNYPGGIRDGMDPLLQAVSTDTNVRIIDIFPAIHRLGAAGYLPDQVHWNPAGHAAAAMEIEWTMRLD